MTVVWIVGVAMATLGVVLSEQKGDGSQPAAPGQPEGPEPLDGDRVRTRTLKERHRSKSGNLRILFADHIARPLEAMTGDAEEKSSDEG